MSGIGKVGDLFQLSKDCYGFVVASSTNEFNLDVYPSEIWENIDAGMFLITNEIDLVHCPFDDEELCFVRNYRSDMSKVELEALLEILCPRGYN